MNRRSDAGIVRRAGIDRRAFGEAGLPDRSASACFAASRSACASAAPAESSRPSERFSAMSVPVHEPAIVGRSCVDTHATALGG